MKIIYNSPNMGHLGLHRGHVHEVLSTDDEMGTYCLLVNGNKFCVKQSSCDVVKPKVIKRVECIIPHIPNGLIAGHRYNVLGISNNYYTLKGVEGPFHKTHFKDVEYKPKVIKRVRSIDNHMTRLTLGHVYDVVKVSTNSYKLTGIPGWCLKSRFEDVEEKPKVIKRVRYIEDNSCMLTKGKVYNVTHICEESGIEVTYVVEGIAGCYAIDRFEDVEDKPKVIKYVRAITSDPYLLHQGRIYNVVSIKGDDDQLYRLEGMECEGLFHRTHFQDVVMPPKFTTVTAKQALDMLADVGPPSENSDLNDLQKFGRIMRVTEKPKPSEWVKWIKCISQGHPHSKKFQLNKIYEIDAVERYGSYFISRTPANGELGGLWAPMVDFTPWDAPSVDKPKPSEDLHTAGAKDDASKLRAGLVLGGFAKALKGVTEVGTMGANKYTDNGWQEVDDAANRYEDAMLRHYLSYKSGECLDAESGLSHLKHLAWNALALVHFEDEREDERRETPKK